MSSAGSTASSAGSSSDSGAAEAAEEARRAAWFKEVDDREEEKVAQAAALFGDAPLPQPAAAEPPVAGEDYCASAAFAGPREGWVFRAGPNGTGYYRDVAPVAVAAPSAPVADGGSAELFSYLDRSSNATQDVGVDGSAGSSHQRSGSGREHGSGGELRLRHLQAVADGLLGEGAQSRVHLYRHPDPPAGHSGELQYAVKTIAKSGLSERAATRVMDEKAALTAAGALWARSPAGVAAAGRPAAAGEILPAPPVVRLSGTDQDGQYLYLIQEFLSKGQLTTLAPLPPLLARYYLAALALAVDTVHTTGFIHRDIKLDNVMLDGEARVRLIDFGLCCKQQITEADTAGGAAGGSEAQATERTSQRCGSLVGTAGCVAPEVLAKQPYGCSADWWAVGVAGFHLLTGAPPHDPACEGAIVGGWNNPINRGAIARWVARLHEPIPTCGAIRAALDDDSRDLGAGGGAEPVLHGLLNPDPAERLGARRGLEELKECAWFEGFDWVGLEAGTLLPPEQHFEFEFGGQAAAPVAVEGEPAVAAAAGSAFADF